MKNRNLKTKVKTAIAWGLPCSESIGYTHSELVELLRLTLERIQYLETTLKDNEIVFTQTDW